MGGFFIAVCHSSTPLWSTNVGPRALTDLSADLRIVPVPVEIGAAGAVN